MKILLDTHTLLWWLVDDSRLSVRVRELIADEHNDVLVSAASAWEIATKHRLGKLPLAGQLMPGYVAMIEEEGFRHLAISPAHALRAGGYAVTHGDPFDRMLAAQAEIDDMPLVTADTAFAQFPVRTFW
ncbi:MAG: type II toxin-antitoxin system VapC family toxin [Candidatus Accumulibacter sp.]|uniref:type II toxin-antitoxin system VapC family toxin n=1 Tax=Accumulibacter sp. TaxID=2053492 RepID=UPI002879F8C4|nr:type II toxin-antitoxin system VapC family toxin [Accumulibacter sp.]MDS4015902.1 type II toxin-antitoxin system VapC family toxin [Accumulibacter sp.]